MQWLKTLINKPGEYLASLLAEAASQQLESIQQELLHFLDDRDGIETTAIVLPDEEQKLLKPPAQ
jgi:hypothetical protein